MYLTLIDILSRYLFMYPIKTRQTSDIMSAYEAFLKDLKNKYGKTPNKLIGDDEFNNKQFINLNEKLDIVTDFQTAGDDHFTKNSSNRLGIIDRLTRTIKTRVLKYQLTSGNINFFNVINEIVQSYNESAHKSLKNKSPEDVFNSEYLQNDKKNEDIVHNMEIKRNIEFDLGDTVRVVKK